MSNPAVNLALLAMIGGSVMACGDQSFVGAGPTEAQRVAASAAATQSRTAAPKLVGPKHSTIVGKFQTIGSFVQQYGDADIGGGLTAMLTSALVQSGHFVVLEQAAIQPLPQPGLGMLGAAGGDANTEAARQAGAQFLIVGAVTEFGTPNPASNTAASSGAFPIGLFGGNGTRGLLSLLSGSATARSVGGSVAIDLRLIDTATNQVMQTATVREDASTFDVSLSAGYGPLQLGGDRVSESPLGRAARTAISKAVAGLIVTAEEAAWRGVVVETDGANLIINAGRNTGIRMGDRFTVERIGRTLTDPVTGEALATRRQVLGTFQVDLIEEKIASGHYNAVSGQFPRRGDVVVASPGSEVTVVSR
jgi:curli biogenesis system outer membrane secretion channel CsgG